MNGSDDKKKFQRLLFKNHKIVNQALNHSNKQIKPETKSTFNFSLLLLVTTCNIYSY